MQTVPLHLPIPSPNASYIDPREYDEYCPVHGYRYGVCQCAQPESGPMFTLSEYRAMIASVDK